MPTRDAREPLDVLVTGPDREGLAGTTPATVYALPREVDEITVAPDGRPPDAQPAWRRDFPIDLPQDEYVARRDFLKFMVLTSLALTTGQFWIAAQSRGRGRETAPGARAITPVGAVPVGGSVTFTYPGEQDPAVLVRLGEAEWVAFSQKCTHLSCAVIPHPEDGIFHCPCHEGVFELRTGRPLAGPPRRPLPRILLDVRDGEVYATGVEYRTV